MKYIQYKNKIVIDDLTQFNINQILDCGQIFRYNIVDNVAEVISLDNYAIIVTLADRVEIITNEVDYFVNFFDLERNYNNIKTKLNNDNFLAPCISYGYGIRILNQDLFEMLVSFIISANNNIKRIKNSLNALSKQFGTKKYVDVKICDLQDNDLKHNNPANIIESTNNTFGNIEGDKIWYYAFPTLQQLKKATVGDYVNAGLGYRAGYMYDTIQKLTEKDLADFKNLNSDAQLQFLLNLKGVGEKVAHCILLFACHDTTRFPVDTWINKVYNDLTNTTTTNRKAISKELTDRYGNLSGYAQQYFFYYYRENKIN